MLLKKEIKDDKIVSLYKSSNIASSTYDQSNNELIVVFKTGGQYLYEGVSVTDYTRFEIDESQGKVLISHIIKYPFKKLDNVDTQPINQEIEETYNALKENEKKESYCKIIDLCNDILTHSTPNPTSLIDCRDAIVNYLDKYHKLVNI